MKTILERWAAPTPKFFKILRNLGLVVGAIGTALLTAPASLPVGLVSLGGYLATAGGVMTAISQLTTNSDEELQKPSPSHEQ